jgi:hypothetical protein
MDSGIGIDVADTLCKHTHFGYAMRGVQGNQLSICVRDSDMIHVNEREGTNGTARKCLCHPGTDAADTDDTDVRTHQP